MFTRFWLESSHLSSFFANTLRFWLFTPFLQFPWCIFQFLVALQSPWIKSQKNRWNSNCKPPGRRESTVPLRHGDPLVFLLFDYYQAQLRSKQSKRNSKRQKGTPNLNFFNPSGPPVNTHDSKGLKLKGIFNLSGNIWLVQKWRRWNKTLLVGGLMGLCVACGTSRNCIFYVDHLKRFFFLILQSLYLMVHIIFCFCF